MKAIKLLVLALAAMSVVSCQPDPVYVPVYVPTQTKAKPAPKKVTYRAAPKPVESAEGFRAVEKPTTYSH